MIQSVENPLLNVTWPARFDEVRSEHVVPAITQLVQTTREALAQAEARLRAIATRASFDDAVTHLTELREPLAKAWGLVNHLLSVRNDQTLRDAHAAVLNEVVDLFLAFGQSVPIYQALKALSSGESWDRLDATQRRILTAALRDAEQSGVALPPAPAERFKEILRELAELGNRFSNHVLDATKAFALDLSSREEVAGLPESLLASAAQAAARAQSNQAGADAASSPPPSAETGPWRITLAAPCYIAFMEHSQRRDLRELLYRANITRASSGELDNLPLIERILALRKEMAGMLGFASFAELSLSNKMAPGVGAVEALLAELRAPALPKARTELDELTVFARSRSQDPRLELANWDIAFWAERLREHRYSYRDEEVRPYFSLPLVLEGLFHTAQHLFGIRVRAADGEVPVWDESVRFFRIVNEHGTDVAAFFLDAYSRTQNKRGGAWMQDAVDRKLKSDGSLQLPVAYIVCNQAAPVGQAPSLMTFREVETLFHEFGHALQHMLTQVERVEAAGINNVEWDAVELPSQFMENWCYDRPTMLGTAQKPGLARHWQSGEVLPDALFDKICAARCYRAGSATARQVYLATVDLELHHRYDPAVDGSALAVQKRIAAVNTVLPPLPEDRFLCSFTHIFAGGYAAGYYSYKWAEVLSADAFSAFEEAGAAQTHAQIGRRFRDTVLAKGGSRHPLEIFAEFRGRPPSTKALLRQSDLEPKH